MDLTEKGIHDFGVRFGEVDGYVRMPELIAKREGVGADLALGTRALAAKYGHPELAIMSRASSSPATIRVAPSA